MMSASSQPVFIVFEGLDGAGKSTCAKVLADSLGAEHMMTPPPELRECRQAVLDSFHGCQAAAQLFYLATVFAASQQVRAALDKGKSVVMDRYFLSTQTYAEFRGSPLGLDGFQGQLVPADLTVYLDAPLEVRRRRLASRGCTSADRETLTAEADARLQASYLEKSTLSVAGQWLRLDNSAESTHDVVTLIAIELRKRKQQLLDDASGAWINEGAT